MSDYKFTNSIKILSIDAKDIYIANHYADSSDEEMPVGYNIRYLQGENQGKINTKRFINTLDSSLDLSEIRSVYKKIYRNSGFSFMENGHEYTTRVINVTFKYSDKEFNKIRKDTYVRSGCNPNQIVFQDHVCFRGNELIAIEVNKPVEHPVPELLPASSFYFEDGVYHAKAGIPTLHTIQELRNILYTEGFYCDGIKYVRYKRSGGSARVGKCLFIDERLYKRMMNWAMCGLKIRENQAVDLAGLEAYIALPLSSIISTIELHPENFLIIDDYTVAEKLDTVKAKFDDAGTGTDGLLESAAELRSTIQDITGFDILNDDGSMKDVYDIIVGIGHEWENLSKVNQTSLLDSLAGAEHGGILESAFENISVIEDAYRTAENSAGSALAEQQKYEQSVQYSLGRLSASWQEFADAALESDSLKGIIGAGNGVLNVLTEITDKYGVLGTLGGLAGLTAGLKNVGVGNYISILQNIVLLF